MAFVKIYYVTVLSLLSCCLAETASKASFSNGDEPKSASDLKTSASERLFDLGTRQSYVPATVYGAPGGGYNPTGYSGYNYNTGIGGIGSYNGYNGYSGLTSPGYTGYSGLNGYNGNNGYNGYVGNGFNTLGTGYSYTSYPGNGGYGGYNGNGGLNSYSGYNYPGYTSQGNLGYGYYRGGLGTGIGTGYRNRYGLTGYNSVTPTYISGYRGYTK